MALSGTTRLRPTGEEDEIASVRGHFRVVTTADGWELYCPKCSCAWTLKGPPVRLGNLLVLLDHAASHEVEP